MRDFKTIAMVLISAFLVSCFSSQEAPKNKAAENVPANQIAVDNSAISDQTEMGVTQKETDVIPKTKDIKSLKSPTETFTTFSVATFNKDVETIKKTLSASALKFVEEAARKQNSTVAEMLTGGAVRNTARKIPEIRNEKISGERATIEVKNAMGSYDSIPLVKENGEWKVALDELNKLAQQKLSEIKRRLSETK